MSVVPLSKDNEKLANEYRDYEKHGYEEDHYNTVKDWIQRLASTRGNVRRLQKKYRKLLYENLQEAYEIYTETLQSPYSDTLFISIRSKLHEYGVKTNRNSTGANLILRFISAEEVSAKTVHDWSSALILAESSNVPGDQFATWLESKKISGAVKELRQLEKNDYDKKDRMHRARCIVLRLLEMRETKPIVTVEKIFAPIIENNYVSPTGLVVALGTATRRFDRESAYGDIFFSLMFAPDKDFELMLLDHLAKKIVDSVERYENKFKEMDEEEWGEELWERLVASDEEAEAAQKKQIT